MGYSFVLVVLWVLLSFLWVSNGFSEDVKEFEEIIVTATKTEKSVADTPGSPKVVTKKDIEIKDVKTLDEAINDISGVMVRRGKGHMDTLSSITLRGIPDQKRTLILMDGVILNNPYTGNVKLGGYYPEDIERVEVVKGPFSSLYGGYAMGGVVNFITKMPEKREFTLKTGYGSGFERGEGMDDLKRFYVSYGDRARDRLSVFLSYGRTDTNGYPTDYNVRTTTPPSGITGWKETYDRYGKKAYLIGDKGDNTWWDDGLTLKAQYDFSKDTRLNLTFMRNRYEYDYDKPHTYLRDASGNPVWNYSGTLENTFLPGAGGRVQNAYGIAFETLVFENIKTKFNFSYLDTESDWYITTLTGATRTGGAGYISETPADAYAGGIQFTLPLFERHLLTFGGDFRKDAAYTKENQLKDWRDNDSKTFLRYESFGKAKNFALFIQDEIMVLENLTFYAGIRGDWWKTYDGFVNDINLTTGRPKSGYPLDLDSRDDSEFSPKLAVVYKPLEGTTVRGSVGKAFRAPSVYELYRTWTSSSGITYAGNPSLKPETTLSWDIGVEQKLWKGAKVEVTYFENYLKDLIYRQTVTPTYQRLINVGKAESRGVEFELEQKIDDFLTLFGNFTYTDSEIKENDVKPSTVGKRMTYTPLWKANVGAKLSKDPVFFYITGRYMDKWYSEDDNSDKKSGVYGSYDEFFVVDAKISYKVKPWLTLSFSVDNLFDEDYYVYYKAPGRSWYGEVSIKF